MSKKPRLANLYQIPLDTPDVVTGGMYDTIPGLRADPATCDPTPENARAAALRAADWLVRTQVNTAENLSGDSGRYFGIRGIYDNASYLTQNWLASHCVLGVLAAWQATGEERYLTSARLGGEYLLGLQVLDPRLPHARGVYREHHARFPLAGSRSGCSVIWAMTQLYNATGVTEYLDSAKMYARWYFDNAFPPGILWPHHDYIIPDNRWCANWAGPYHGGVAGIFHQLYKASGDEEMLRRGVLEIADKYIQYFLLSDGARRQAVDVNTGQPTAHNATSFHIYNDDFAGLGLLAAYKETKNEKYLDASTRQGRWLAARTEESGRLGGISSAPATAMVHFLAHRKITGTTEFDEPMRRYAHYLMSQQVTKIARSDFAGGICGQSHVNAADESGQYIDGRTTSYAICALLGFANPNERMFLDVE